MIKAFEDSNGLWGYKDSDGHIVIKPMFIYAEDFSDIYATSTCAISNNGDWVDILPDGSFIFHIQLDKYESDGRYGFKDHSERYLISAIYEDVKDFNEGLAAVKLDGKWGFINQCGNVVIPIIYQDAECFSEGLGLVKSFDKWGWIYIDKSGIQAIDDAYEFAEPFSEGLAAVAEDYSMGYYSPVWGYIDKRGVLVIEPQFDWAYDFKNGYAHVGFSFCGGMGYIDRNGEIVIPFEYDRCPCDRYTDKGYFIVCKKRKYGCVNIEGKTVVPLVHESWIDVEDYLYKLITRQNG